ncbi:hypothetical protein D3C75_802150 [compost metagenome]|uniref:YbaN family protein n=1 Tax=Acinetobacter guillouiae TaxID=106649 RepID=UPI000F92BEF4
MKKVSSVSNHTQGKDLTLLASLPVTPSANLHSSSVVRVICIILAILCLVLAVVGIVLPGIPTFDFLFLATIFASKGSARLHRWLHQNRYIAMLLSQYRGGFKQISRSRKWMMTLSILFGTTMLMVSSLHLHLKLSLLVILLIGLIWIWTRPEKI